MFEYGVPLRTVPDYCEMGLVANATGFIPDCSEMHTPLLRPIELADAFQLESEGGLLEGEGRIDVFNCLRREDEMSFAGGVFVIVESLAWHFKSPLYTLDNVLFLAMYLFWNSLNRLRSKSVNALSLAILWF